MPANLVKSGSNVADLITSAGLFGNALAKDQERQSSDQTAATKHTRRQVTSRANSVDPPALIATGLLSRSASAKLQSPVSSWPSWSASFPKQSPHDVPTSVRPTEESAQEVPSLVATSVLTNTNSPSGFQISAAKPSLLAQIQAVSQQAASSPTARQQSSSHSQPHSDVNASGADAAQATVSDKVADTAIAAKHVSSAAAAAAFPQAYDERGASSVSPKLNTSRQHSSDSIFGEGDAEAQEGDHTDLPAGRSQRPGSAVARQGNRLTDETLQATIREAQAMAANADISRRKAERRAQKLDQEVSHLQTQLTNHQRQTDMLQQQSSARLSQLEGILSELEKKHQGSAAVLEQTTAAMQTRTSILLQQRRSGQNEAAAAQQGPTSSSPQLKKKSVEKKSRVKREMPPEAWDASHSALQQRAQTLKTQVKLTRLRAEGEVLRAEASEALTEAQAKQGVINMLQQQLSAAHSQHDKEVKELKRAAKLMGRRTEELTQQLPKTDGDSSLQVQAIWDDHAKQRHAWASARRTLQAQQSSLQDECNDLACQLAERDQQLQARDERISYLKKLLEEANLAVTSRRNSEAVALDVELGSGPLVTCGSKESSGPAQPERAPSDVEPNLDLPARLTLQRYRNEASAAKYEMTAVMKELKRHKKESERVQLQQQLSIRGLKEQVNLAQQALQQQVEVNEFGRILRLSAHGEGL
ncbi:hypothetical protein WJX82_011048 [Trebouxia sp. C0006]